MAANKQKLSRAKQTGVTLVGVCGERGTEVGGSKECRVTYIVTYTFISARAVYICLKEYVIVFAGN